MWFIYIQTRRNQSKTVIVSLYFTTCTSTRTTGYICDCDLHLLSTQLILVTSIYHTCPAVTAIYYTCPAVMAIYHTCPAVMAIYHTCPAVMAIYHECPAVMAIYHTCPTVTAI